jgi:microcystin-dependent protein
MKVFGELEKAQLEQLSSDPTGDNIYDGRIYFNTTDEDVKICKNDEVQSIIPVGVVQDYAGSSAPDGWLICDGSTLDSVANTKYAKLYAILGTTYGGTGADDFKLPDARGRSTVGVGTGAGLTARNLGDSSGAEDVDLQHSHTVDNHNHKWYNPRSPQDDQSYNSSGSAIDLDQASPGGSLGIVSSSTSQGLNTNFYTSNDNPGTNNQLSATQDVMNPFLALNKIIKY